MIFADDSAIERHTKRMIDTSLPKAEWTHAGHFAAALWILRHRADLASPDAFRRLIMVYNEATGTPNSDTGGYHHSITIASIRAAAFHLKAHASDAPLHEVLDKVMASPQGKSDWLLTYWRRDTLFSVTARRTWIEPDLAPLPF